MKEVAILLFNEFETLDVYGPVEIFGRHPNLYNLRYFSENGGKITNRHNVSVLTEKLENIPQKPEIFFIPGGFGTRELVENKLFIDQIKTICENSTFVLTVCTGSALLAKTGLLNGRNATSNKRSFEWVMAQGPAVNWIKKSRWEADGKFYTSSGVSAGMDMTLGFLSEMHDIEFSRKIAFDIEYVWNEDKENDPFEI
jgi:putative intracellular protease/amidase